MRIFLLFFSWGDSEKHVFMRVSKVPRGEKCKKILSKILLQNLPLAIVDGKKYSQYNGIIDKRLSYLFHEWQQKIYTKKRRKKED